MSSFVTRFAKSISVWLRFVLRYETLLFSPFMEDTFIILICNQMKKFGHV